MTEQKRELPNFQKYQYGALAARLALSKESARYMPGALEKLVGPEGLNFGKAAEGIVHGWRASLAKGEQTAVLTSINYYNQQFEEERGEYKPIELVNSWYAPVLNSIDAEDRAKIVAYLGKYDETLDVINSKDTEARHTLEGKEKGIKSYTPERVSAANETMTKYGKVLQIIETLDNYVFEDLRPDVVKAARTRDLKDLASKL